MAVPATGVRPQGERPASDAPLRPRRDPPYANRGEEEARPPNLGDEFEAGDRGAHSGTTLEQMREVRRKP
jgi:hypothetical protein